MRSEEETKNGSLLPERYNRFQLTAVFVSVIIAYIITAPPIYRYGVSNHNTQLILIKNTLEPSYLANDWYVDAATGFGTPYYYYVELVAMISGIIGLPNAVFLLYLLSLIGIVAGIWFFIAEIYQDQLVATISVGLILAHGAALPGIIPFPPSLGGNSLFRSFFIPSHFANAFILIGLVYAVKARYRYSFALLGIATVFHVVNGFWIAVTVGLCAVAVEAGPDLREKKLRLAIKKIPWDAALVYGVISSLVILPLLYSQLSIDSGFDATYINAWVRNPHHFILSTWSTVGTAITILFILVAIFLIYLFGDLLFSTERDRLFAFSYILSLVSIMFFGGYVFTEIMPISTIINLQPYRIDDYLYLILYGGVAKLIVIGLYQTSQRFSSDPTRFPISVILAVVIVVTVIWTVPVMMTQMGSDRFVESHNQGFGANQSVSEIYIQTPSHDEDLKEAYRWIETETPEDAVFLAPPSQQGFRLGTSRALVVDFKAFPPGGEGPVQWEQRMNAVCNADIRQYDNSGFSISEACDDGFYNMTESEMKMVAESYNADWVLTKNGDYSFQHEYSAGDYHIYKIDSSDI